jgi:molecular chaperone IbpA
LKPNPILLIHLSPIGGGVRSALWGSGIETGTGRVRCLIPILLFGGFGYAHLRLLSPVPIDHRIRSPVRPRRDGPAGLSPYNIERLAEDRYQISLAVAGFSPDEVSITAEQNVVTIEGGKTEKAEREFLYRGISTRHFKRQFSLADYVQVKGATFDNGLLKIELVREIPEAMKPRRIAINGASTADNVHQIEAKAA